MQLLDYSKSLPKIGMFDDLPSQQEIKQTQGINSIKQLYSDPEFQKLPIEQQQQKMMPYVAAINPEAAMNMSQNIAERQQKLLDQKRKEEKEIKDQKFQLTYNALAPSFEAALKDPTITQEKLNSMIADAKKNNPILSEYLGENFSLNKLPQGHQVINSRTLSPEEARKFGVPYSKNEVYNIKSIFDADNKLINQSVEGLSAEDKETRDYRKKELQLKERELNIKNKNASGTSGLTPEGINLVADLIKGGQDPNLGFGGAKAKIAAYNQLAKEGAAASTIADAKSTLKANQQALGQIEKQKSQIGAFEKTANSNLNLALKLSDKTNRTGVPVVDRWIMSGRKATGDKDVAAFDTAIRVAINEATKVTSGGGQVISDSARKEIEGILNSHMSKEQIKASIGVLIQDLSNRMKGFDSQINEIHTNIKNINKQSQISTDKNNDPLGIF